MRRIKKGDQVIVIAGKDKGKRGSVVRIVDADRAVVDNVNVVKRHTKPNPQKGVSGGIIEKEMPVHISNIAMYNPATGKGDRIGFRTLADGRKVRFFRSTDEVVDV